MSNGPLYSPPAGKCRSRWLRLLAATILGLGWLGAWAQATSLEAEVPRADPPVIRSATDFWTVPEETKSRALPVNMELTAYYYDPSWNLLWAGSESGHFFLPLVAGEPLDLKSGQRVRLEGSVVPARGFSGQSLRVTVLADDAWPEPQVLAEGGRDEAVADAAWVQLEGYVFRQLESDVGHMQYYLLHGGRRLSVRLQLGSTEAIPQLLNLRVRLKAVRVGTRDPAGRLLRVDLWVPRSRDIEVLGRLEEDERFKLPRTPIESLGSALGREWVKIGGSVQSRQEGESLTVRDGSGQLLVLTAQPGETSPGGAVEIVGRPRLSQEGVTLDAPLFRPAATVRSSALFTPLSEPGSAVMRKLRIAAQVLELDQVEAKRGFPVALRGVVTWSNPSADFFFLQDVSGGVRVSGVQRLGRPPVAGATLAVEGTTLPGTYAPEIGLTRSAELNTLARPSPRAVTLEQALTGGEEGRWVQLRGYLREARREGDWMRLYLTTATGEFSAYLPPETEWSAQVGAVIRITGVCAAEADDQRQLTGVRLWVPGPEEVTVEQARPADPFAAPLRAIVSLRQFNPYQSFNQRVRLVGTITAQEPGRYFHLQQGGAGLLVLSRDPQPLPVGATVEVVGFPGRDGPRTVLREGAWRLAPSPVPAPEPVDLAAPAVLAPEGDARLVRLKATLLDVRSSGGESRLSLQAGDRIFVATGVSAPPWQSGSLLELTGVYLLEFDEYGRPRSFALRLRSEADVKVLAAPSWWTLGRLGFVVAGLAACIGLGVGWVVVLRRRVQKQTEQIRTQLEREARLQTELERSSRLESLGILAGGIAHDFNNLLTAIVGNLGLIALDERAMEGSGACVENARRAARRAGDITQQLLTFAKGGNPVRRAQALPELVREAAGFALHGARVRAEFDFAPSAPAAEIDAGQISRVIHNLVLNAVQAMPEGGVVRLGLQEAFVLENEVGALPAGRYVVLTVTDTGPGIPAETQARLFEPYFSTKRGNSGLGLATVRSIVQKHDGHIAVESDVGRGTTFRIWLPAAAVAQAPAALAAASAPVSRRALRVLLMDDEAIIRDIGAQALARHGHQTEAVMDGGAAVQAYSAARQDGRPFDVVILDLTVPGGMGGEEAVRELLRLDPAARVIVSSGYSSNPVMARYREHGFCAVVPKPYELDALLQAVEQAART